jgi:hypothetical protein
MLFFEWRQYASNTAYFRRCFFSLSLVILEVEAVLHNRQNYGVWTDVFEHRDGRNRQQAPAN